MKTQLSKSIHLVIPSRKDVQVEIYHREVIPNRVHHARQARVNLEKELMYEGLSPGPDGRVTGMSSSIYSEIVRHRHHLERCVMELPV